MIYRPWAECKLLYAAMRVDSAPVPRQCRTGLMPKTADNMIVDQSGRLHVRVNDRAADKLEAALFEVFTQRVRLGRCCRHVTVFSETVLYRFAANEIPDVFAEAAELLLYRNERLRVADRRSNLQPVPDDAGIL